MEADNPPWYWEGKKNDEPTIRRAERRGIDVLVCSSAEGGGGLMAADVRVADLNRDGTVPARPNKDVDALHHGETWHCIS